jgi:hypothetical protein
MRNSDDASLLIVDILEAFRFGIMFPTAHFGLFAGGVPIA